MAPKRTGKKTKTQPTVIPCDDSLDISVVHELYQTLQQVVETSNPLVIDATNVERIDTAGLQLLCAFMQHAQDRSITVQWHQPAPAVYDAARLLDLEGLLHLAPSLPHDRSPEPTQS